MNKYSNNFYTLISKEVIIIVKIDKIIKLKLTKNNRDSTSYSFFAIKHSFLTKYEKKRKFIISVEKNLCNHV